MPDKGPGGGTGSSSQKDGANERAADAAKSVGLADEKGRESFQRELEKERENLTFRELQERAREHKKK